MYKVLMCDDGLGKAKGTKSPTPGPRQQQENFPLEGEQGQPQVPRVLRGRQGLPPPALGLGDWETPCSSWAGGTQKREPSACSLKRVGMGTEGASEPLCRENWWETEEALGISENGVAPLVLILAELEASPSGHLQYLPHPHPGSWLNTQGSQRH